MRRVQLVADGVDRVHLDALGESRLVADQPLQPRLQRVGQRVGERRQQHPRIRVARAPGTTARCSATIVLPVPAEPGDARRAGIVALDPLRAAPGCRKTVHFSHGKFERALQLLDIGHHAEAPLRVGMVERVRRRRPAHGTRGVAARRELQQRLGGLGRQVIGQVEQRVLGGLTHVGQPLRRHAVAEQRRRRRCRRTAAAWLAAAAASPRTYVGTTISSHPLADLHELRRAGLRVRLQLAPLGPVVGVVVVVDVAEQQAVGGPVDDQPDVALTRTDQKFLSFARSSLWKLKPGLAGIELQVEGGRLDRLLLVAGQPCEAVGEGVGDAEVHLVRVCP